MYKRQSLQKEADLIQKDLMEIMLGRKTYPKEREEARREIQKGLYEQFGKNIPVRILADLLDIRDEKWKMCIRDRFLEEDRLEEEQLIQLIRERKLFPCFYGSALKLTLSLIHIYAA